MLSTRCCKLLAYELLSVIQFHMSTWFNLEMSDWRCRIMIIMIPLQLSVCITEELFAKYLYYYPDTGNQITFQLSQMMYCEWYLDWDMHAFIWICWQCSGLSTSLPLNFDQLFVYFCSFPLLIWYLFYLVELMDCFVKVLF